MIIRSHFRRSGGLARHLLRTDTNRSVVIEAEFVRGCADNVSDALSLFAMIAATNARAKRAYVHFKVSPAYALDRAMLATTLDMIDTEFAIPETTPRHVVSHAKGDRVDHFHVVYALVDPFTGRAIKSHGNFLKDEIISRRCELLFGEPIVSGPRQKDVVEALQARGLEDQADILSHHPQVTSGSRIDGRPRQQAERLGTDAEAVMRQSLR